MEETQEARPGSVPTLTPWLVAAVALVVYLLTLNHWVTLSSLPLVAKVTGWDWVLPHQNPLFYAVTYPFRWLPVGIQPIALNAFTAFLGALTLGLLARSVTLLPHDRTHEQRQRERSEFSLLTIRTAWLPPMLAALVCGLQLTFWENAIAATGEMLDLLVFAYAIRCLLEFRIDQRDSWLYRFAFIYGLGVTNNWALIGFLPLFLVAVIWIKGWQIFQFGFLLRFAALGLLGLALYLVLPLAWSLSNHPSVTFWDALRANVGTQKSMLLYPGLRTRAILLSLTSILPLFIIGIRWPSSFGDTSAAGAAMTNLMFRVIHVVLFVACLWVSFDQKFSPRALGFGLPFLTFYYLGALAIGYFAGYLILVFGEQRPVKAWRRRSGSSQLFGKVVVGLVFLATIGVPAGLIYKNVPPIRQSTAATLSHLSAACAQGLPANGAIVLSDDPYPLLLLEAELDRQGGAKKHVLVHTRSLVNPDYHVQLARRYPNRWPTRLANADEVFDDGTLLKLMTELARSNEIYYLHPSFGYYFERFHARPNGLVSKLELYPDDTLNGLRLDADTVAANQTFWNGQKEALAALGRVKGSVDGTYVQRFYSRALNAWGVALQREKKLTEAAPWFETAAEFNTNNVPAYVNSAYNAALRSGTTVTNLTAQAITDRFGPYRGWDVLLHNGPFDQPEFTYQLGEIFREQRLFRQSMIEFQRVAELQPSNLVAQVAIANVYLQSSRPAEAIEQVRRIRSTQAPQLNEQAQVELIRLEANAELSRTNLVGAEKLLLEARQRHPKNTAILDTLVQIYGHAKIARYDDALKILDDLLKIAPDNIQVQINQATVHFNTRSYDKALAILDGILQRSPNNIPAQLYKIFVYVQLKEYDKARPILENVLRTEPRNSEALVYDGVIAIETKNYSAAIEPLTRVLDESPNNWNALRNRAIAYLHMGKLDKARDDYKLLSQLVPSYHVAYYGLGEIAYREKDAKAAIKAYERYLEFVPKVESPELVEEQKVIAQRLTELKGQQRP